MKITILDTDFEIPTGQPVGTLTRANVDCEIHDIGDGKAVAVCSRNKGISKEDALREIPLSEIYAKCKELGLELVQVIIR